MTKVRITKLQKGVTETTPRFHTMIKTLRNTKIQKPKQKLITSGTKSLKKEKVSKHKQEYMTKIREEYFSGFQAN